MSKQPLSEGLFDKIVSFLLRGKINKGIENLKKDPEVKQKINNFLDAKEDLKKSLANYEEKYGDDAFSKKAKAMQTKYFGN